MLWAANFCQFSWQNFLWQGSLHSLRVHKVRKERAVPSLALCAKLPSIPVVADVLLVEVADTARLAAGSIFSTGVLGDAREQR